MSSRMITISDVHGCSVALKGLIEAIEPNEEDVLVFLGDYCDRGSDSKGVFDQIIELKNRCKVIPILGNHDEMMLVVRSNPSKVQAWLRCVGTSTLQSYGSDSDFTLIPESHLDFLQSCVRFFETDDHIFVHANYKPHLPMREQSGYSSRWLSLRDYVPPPHFSGKTVYVGHTSQKSREILNLGHLVCIDTGCVYGGWLTAVDVHNGTVWQANEAGNLRTDFSSISG